MEYAINDTQSMLSTIDILWFLFSCATTILLAIVAWLTRKMVSKLEDMDEKLGTMAVEQGKIHQRLDDHIENVGMHCNFPVCGKRVSDA